MVAGHHKVLVVTVTYPSQHVMRMRLALAPGGSGCDGMKLLSTQVGRSMIGQALLPAACLTAPGTFHEGKGPSAIAASSSSLCPPACMPAPLTPLPPSYVPLSPRE